MTIEGIARAIKRHIIGQSDGQILFTLGHNAACIAVDNRDRTAPIALPRQTPIAQAIVGHPCAPAVLFGKGDGGRDRLFARGDIKAGEMIDPFHLFGFRGDKCGIFNRCRCLQRHERIAHRQVIFTRKIEIPLIMGRTGKNRACAVIHQNEISDPNRQLPRGIKGVLHPQPRVEAFFLGLFKVSGRCAHLPALGIKRGGVGICLFNFARKGMIGRNPDEGGAHQCVGARCVDVDLIEPIGGIHGFEGKF